jgi:hypothetical protein
MEAEFPRVAVSLDHLRLLSHVLIVVVAHVPLANEGLKFDPKFTP